MGERKTTRLPKQSGLPGTRGRVLAIDPGYDRLGIAVMEKDALIFSECFVPPKGTLPARLASVYQRVNTLIQHYAPESMATETLFFTKNQKTAMAVAEARGVILLAAENSGISLFEYSPQAVKIAVTGNGSATKDGVAKMVEKILKLPSKKRLDDEYDAIALAIAHLASVSRFA
jgi:crossover junction endodeoxyribonuclease RuvC